MSWNGLVKAQTSNFNPIVRQRIPSNLKELEQFCLEEWSKIPVTRCAKLMKTYPKRLAAAIAAKGGSTKCIDFEEVNSYASSNCLFLKNYVSQ